MMGMLYRIVIEAEGEDPQGLKEDLASALERYGPARVVAVEPKERWRQEGMFDRGPAAQYAGGCGHPPLRKAAAETGNPWERADKAWEKVMEEKK